MCMWRKFGSRNIDAWDGWVEEDSDVEERLNLILKNKHGICIHITEGLSCAITCSLNM